MKSEQKKTRKPRFVPIIEVQNIDDNRDLIISRAPIEGYTIAQKAAVEDNGKKFSVYLKNAVHVANLECLKEIASALNEVVKIEEKRFMEESLQNKTNK